MLDVRGLDALPFLHSEAFMGWRARVLVSSEFGPCGWDGWVRDTDWDGQVYNVLCVFPFGFGSVWYKCRFDISLSSKLGAESSSVPPLSFPIRASLAVDLALLVHAFPRGTLLCKCWYCTCRSPIHVIRSHSFPLATQGCITSPRLHAIRLAHSLTIAPTRVVHK